MNNTCFPSLDMKATGQNIARLRENRGLSVKDLQEYFGFDQPQAIYKWQWGKSLPSVDNLYALSQVLGVSMDDILIESNQDIVFFVGFEAHLVRKAYETIKRHRGSQQRAYFGLPLQGFSLQRMHVAASLH